MELENLDYLCGVVDYVSERLGLHFPQQRRLDLLRSLSAAAPEMGFAGRTDELVRWLGNSPELTPEQFEVLTSYLTVGETYFFREPRHFEVLAEQILPEILDRRRGGDRNLRIWSAACCTGEEAYSIAMVLRQVIPDWESWRITLLATDINPRFLRKAREGFFGQWSFRNRPTGFKEHYFREVASGRFEILPELRRMVRFEALNLADHSGATALTDAMDIIFCRNVLMYFTATLATQVISRFHRSQMEGGWLILGSSELSHASMSPYSVTRLPGAILYRKSTRELKRAPPPRLAPARTDGHPVPQPSPPLSLDNVALSERPRRQTSPDIHGDGLLSRRHANAGNLAEARDHCERWIAEEKSNPAAHYLYALILQEQGNVEGAKQSLRSALYLDPGFALAHFALGHLSRVSGQATVARKHFVNAAEALRGVDPVAVLPESDGITAGELARMIEALLREGVVA